MNNKNAYIGYNRIGHAAKKVAEAIDTKVSLINPGEPIVLLGVLKGSVMWMAELMKHLKCKCEIDFIEVSSYDGYFSTGKLKWNKKPTLNLKDRWVIIVEDIVDTGVTCNKIQEYLWAKHDPIKIEICSMLAREGVMEIPEYYGYLIPKNEFVVGFGLDNNQLERNSADIYSVKIKEI